MPVEDWGVEDPEVHELQELADVLAALSDEGEPVATGFPPLDRNLRHGGLTPGKVVAIGGPPGAFKTTLASMLLNTLSVQARGLGLFTDEGSSAAAVKLGQQLGYKRDSLEKGALELLPFIRERMAGTFVLYSPDTPGSCASRAIELLSKLPPSNGTPPDQESRTLVLDSAQTILWTADQEEDPEDRMAITRLMWGVQKEVKKRHWRAIITSHGNYESFKYKKESANINPLAAFAGARAIPYSADIAIVFGIPNEYDVAKVWIAKNRMGPKEIFYVKLDRERASLIEVDATEMEESEQTEKQRLEHKRMEKMFPYILSELAKSPGLTATQIAEAMPGRKQEKLKAIALLEEMERIVGIRNIRKRKVYDLA